MYSHPTLRFPPFFRLLALLKWEYGSDIVESIQGKGGEIMASELVVKKSLVLSFEEGIDKDGKPVIKRYTYNNIQIAAPAQNLLDAAQAIADLFKGTPTEFNTVSNNDLLY